MRRGVAHITLRIVMLLMIVAACSSSSDLGAGVASVEAAVELSGSEAPSPPPLGDMQHGIDRPEETEEQQQRVNVVSDQSEHDQNKHKG